MPYRCATCGKEHEGLPDVGMYAPDYYLSVPESDRATRTTFSVDRCTVRSEDGEHYFIRGVILIPLKGRQDAFGIGAWVSQSRDNYERYARNEAMGPTSGWLSNRIAAYAESTLSLRTRAHFTADDKRPTIELEPTDHPLSIDQRMGITLARAWEIVHCSLPG
jgi:hypothetical protein